MKFSDQNRGWLAGLGLLLLLALTVGSPASARAAAEDVAMFYDELTPYGTWVDYGDYGPVWYPTQGVTSNWRPYVDGRWVPTDDGWTFETSEPWGWATYHWGNWMPTSEYGWVWAPGSTWYPSTAAWRTSDDYVGWAPIPPPDYVPEPAYYPSGGYYPDMPVMDLLSAPFWIFAQAANFLLGFDQPYQPAYSYYNTGYLAPYDYVPFIFANSLLLSDFYYPGYAPGGYYCYGPSFPYVSRVCNINIANINNFARRARFRDFHHVLPPDRVLNRHPYLRNALPASVREGRSFQAHRATNVAAAGRNLARPGVVRAPSNVPKLTREIPKGGPPATRGAGPAAIRGGAKGVAAPRGPSAPEHGRPTPPTVRGGATGETGPHVVTAPGRAPSGQFVAPGREHAVAPREFRAPTRAPSREFRAPSRGMSMPPTSTHEFTPQMHQQMRQFRAPAQHFAPSAPRMAPVGPGAVAAHPIWAVGGGGGPRGGGGGGGGGPHGGGGGHHR